MTPVVLEVVGVVTTFSYRSLREESEQAYFPMLDGGEGVDVAGNFYVKVRGTPELAVQSIRALVHAADPALPITYVRTIDEQVSRSLNAERMLATLSGGFGALALLLSLVGLCGVMSFVVSQRTHEIGIRIALGARGSAAVWLVLRDAAAMIGAGTAIALPCVGVFGRLVESQLFGVTPTDPVTIAGTTALLAIVAACAPERPPPSPWQRPDVSSASTVEVERDCQRRAIEAIGPGNNPTDAAEVHQQRQAYVARCMTGSGFTRR